MVFTSASEAETARGILANGATFTISDTETWLDGFNFVMAGDISVNLEDVTRDLWLISADFVEVIP
jgi:hypothetical protein